MRRTSASKILPSEACDTAPWLIAVLGAAAGASPAASSPAGSASEVSRVCDPPRCGATQPASLPAPDALEALRADERAPRFRMLRKGMLLASASLLPHTQRPMPAETHSRCESPLMSPVPGSVASRAYWRGTQSGLVHRDCPRARAQPTTQAGVVTAQRRQRRRTSALRSVLIEKVRLSVRSENGQASRHGYQCDTSVFWIAATGSRGCTWKPHLRVDGGLRGMRWRHQPPTLAWRCHCGGHDECAKSVRKNPSQKTAGRQPSCEVGCAAAISQHSAAQRAKDMVVSLKAACIWSAPTCSALQPSENRKA